MGLPDWRKSIEARKAQGLYRQRLCLESAQGPLITVQGERLLAFCSNDYLGLASDPRLAESASQAMHEAGFGAGASHLVTGHHRFHHQLEEALAEFTGREAALLFSTGYSANLGVLSALCDRGDTLVEDKLNHASLLDGARLSGARLLRFHHNDTESLNTRLDQAEGLKLVAVDGVFSMDGDLAPLPEQVDACTAGQALLMVDDAHGFGVLGNTGRGTLEHYGLSAHQVPILMGTLGKALGTSGAFIAGSRDLIDMLIQFARPYIYTTAMPPLIAAATLKSLDILTQESWRREHLRNLIHRFRQGALAQGWDLMPSPSPIQPIRVGSAEAALRLSAQLRTRGILVTAIRPPTVPAGASRLRITLTAAHTDAQVDTLLSVLNELAPHHRHV